MGHVSDHVLDTACASSTLAECMVVPEQYLQIHTYVCTFVLTYVHTLFCLLTLKVVTRDRHHKDKKLHKRQFMHMYPGCVCVCVVRWGGVG